MGRRLPHTPRSVIKSALHRLWMRSRERSAALRATGYHCAACRAKQSAAKGREVRLDVHHLDGVEWDQIVELIRRHLLVDPERLLPLCHECHSAAHDQAEDYQAMPRHERKRSPA